MFQNVDFTRKNKMNLIFRKEKKFGFERIYPENREAKIILTIADRSTLSRDYIPLLNELGLMVTLRGQEIEVFE